MKICFSCSECFKMIENLTLLGESLSYELKKAEERITLLNRQLRMAMKEATIDPLTEAFNRKALYEDVKPMIHAGQNKSLDLVVVMLDVDNFKGVNDRYGHAGGDHVLQYLVQSIQKVIRKTDKIYRFGGEEFLIVLNRCHIAGALAIAEKIRSRTQQGQCTFDTHLIEVTVSIGIASHIRGDTFESMVKRADDALYRAKEGGKNRVIVFDNVRI